MRSYFWPFTDVLREIWPGVTRKNGAFVIFAAEPAESAAEVQWRPSLTANLSSSARVNSLRDAPACRGRRDATSSSDGGPRAFSKILWPFSPFNGAAATQWKTGIPSARAGSAISPTDETSVFLSLARRLRPFSKCSVDRAKPVLTRRKICAGLRLLFLAEFLETRIVA